MHNNSCVLDHFKVGSNGDRNGVVDAGIRRRLSDVFDGEHRSMHTHRLLVNSYVRAVHWNSSDSDTIPFGRNVYQLSILQYCGRDRVRCTCRIADLELERDVGADRKVRSDVKSQCFFLRVPLSAARHTGISDEP